MRPKGEDEYYSLIGNEDLIFGWELPGMKSE